MALDKPNVRAPCPKDKLEFIFFFQALHQKHSLGLYCFFGLFVYICSTAYANDTEMTPYP